MEVHTEGCPLQHERPQKAGEPTCVSYNAMFERAGGFRPGHYVSIFGAGPIGLAAAGLAKAAGASTVVSFELSPQRRELAKKVGADYVYDPGEVKPSEILKTSKDFWLGDDSGKFLDSLGDTFKEGASLIGEDLKKVLKSFGIDFENIHAVSCGNFFTGNAAVAWLAGFAIMAIQRLGKDSRRRCFPATAWPGEKERMGDPVTLKSVEQSSRDMLLPNEFMKIPGTPFTS